MQAEEMMDRQSGGRSSVYLIRVRRTIRVIALSLVIAGFGTTAAQAEVCKYLGGDRDLGPCIEFKNQGGGNNFDLWCQQGPTSRSHKIILNNGDRFTCRASAARPNALVGKTIYNNHRDNWNFECDIGEKHIVILSRRGTHGLQGTWVDVCRRLSW